VREEPFRDFASSLRELRGRTDEALAANAELAHERFVEQTASGERSRDAAGTGPGEGTRRSVRGPRARPQILFLAAGRFREAVDHLNAGYVAYGTLLAELATGSLPSDERLDALASRVNADLSGGLERLGVQAGSQPPALLSTIIVGQFRAYLAHRRAGQLKHADRQPSRFRELCRRGPAGDPARHTAGLAGVR